MRILKVTIENFLTIGHAVIELDHRGLVLVQGENKDDTSAHSNGSGKSSILNALCWGLYGVTSHGLKADAVVNRKVAKNCRVMVSVDDDGEQYSIIRHRKHKEGKNRVQVFNSEGELTRGTDALTDMMIAKLIGSTKDVFLASVYASQENMASLPDMSDKMLKAIVEESAGVDRLTKAYEIACKRFNVLTPKVSAAESVTATKTALIASIKSDLDSLNARAFEWEGCQGDKVTAAEKDAKDYIKKIREQVELIKSLGESEVLSSKAQKLDKAMSGIDSKIDEKNKLVEARSLLLALQNSKYESAENEKDTARKLLIGAKKVDEQVGTPCSECGKAYCEEDLAHVRNAHKMNAVSHIDRSKELDREAKAADVDLDELDQRIEKVKSSIPDISRLNSGLQKIKDEISNIKAENEKLKPMKAELVRLTNLADSIKKEINPYFEQIDEKDAALKKSTADKETAELVLSKLLKIQANLEATKAVYSPKGVRNHILSSVTPFLNERTAHYLNTLSDGAIEAVWQTVELTKKGEARDKFAIAVTNKLGGDSFAALSGGEKRKVRLSTTLALQDLVASRATKSIQLFCGDEIDDALDGAGLERLMGILEAKARERGTVMIISHNELKSWVSEFITVVKRDGVSTVE